MILFSQFGYALRHSMSYNPKSKPGNLRLWASYNGSLLAPNPIQNGDSSLLEFLASQFRRGPFFGESNYVDFSIGNDDDVFSILAACKMIKTGRNSSFKNYAGRTISFSCSKADNRNHDVILVQIRHKTATGMITPKEINELEIVTRNILSNLKYSKQEIAEKVEHAIAQSAIQEDENAKETL
jgi:hypothetical protein